MKFNIYDNIKNAYHSLNNNYILPVMAGTAFLLSGCDENKLSRQIYTDSTVPHTEVNSENFGSGKINVNINGIQINSDHKLKENAEMSEKIKRKLDSVLEVKLDSILEAMNPKK